MELFWKMKTPVRSELKQQGCCKGFVSLGRWRPQRECQKSSKFILAKEDLCTCSILLGTFFFFFDYDVKLPSFTFYREGNGDLKQRRRRQQQERQKRNRFDKQNNNFARASRFLYISLPSLHDYEVKAPNFTFCEGREHKATTFCFFSCTLTQSFRIQRQKNMPTFDELHEME